MPNLYDITTIQNGTATVSLNASDVTITGTNGSGLTAPYLNILPENASAGEGGQLTLQGAGANSLVNFDNFQGWARVHTMAAGKGFLVLTADGTTELRGNMVISEDWTAPTMINGWVNYNAGVFNPCGYFRDKFGVVHLRGLIMSGTVPSTVFTLPAGYRPPYRELYHMHATGGAGRLDVLATGEVYVSAGTASYIQLDGIQFRAL